MQKFDLVERKYLLLIQQFTKEKDPARVRELNRRLFTYRSVYQNYERPKE